MPRCWRFLLTILSICLSGAGVLAGSSTTLRPSPVAAAGSGVTERVSVGGAGVQGNGPSYVGGSPFSADGRYVAFISNASNLVLGDTNGAIDVFVHDRVTGSTERVSVDSAGGEANGGAESATISADGRYVAFGSRASNLVASDTNGALDFFVHDRTTGLTERVSVDSNGNQGTFNYLDSSASLPPSISADGRYVAFTSVLSNLVAGDTNGGPDVFVHDLKTGATELASVDINGNQGMGDSMTAAFSGHGVSISADGRYVAFQSNAVNLVAGDTNGTSYPGWDVFVHDRTTGLTERVSVDSNGNQANNGSLLPRISADGRYVTFISWASNLVSGDTKIVQGLFSHDRVTGVTELVSELASASLSLSSMSADGRYVAFVSYAANLVPNDTNNFYDAFVYDRVNASTERVSVDSDGVQGIFGADGASVSGDGRYAAFNSYSANLVAGDTNGTGDVFVRDRCPDGTCGSPQRQILDSATSTIVVSPTSATVGCPSTANVTVTLVGTDGNPYLTSATVQLTSSRGSVDTISGSPTTTSTGTASFAMCSMTPGTATISATVDGAPLTNTASATFNAIPVDPNTVVIFVQGFLSCLTEGHEYGTSCGSTASSSEPFAPIKAELKAFGLTDRNFVDFSYSGGHFDRANQWVPNNYTCTDVGLRSYADASSTLIFLITRYKVRHPDSQIVVVGHSFGGLVATDALRRLTEARDVGDVSPLPIRGFVTIDSPLDGVTGTWVSDYADGLISHLPNSVVSKCQKTFFKGAASSSVADLYRRTHKPGVVVTPFGLSKELAGLAGTTVENAGNDADCLWSPSTCSPYDFKGGVVAAGRVDYGDTQYVGSSHNLRTFVAPDCRQPTMVRPCTIADASSSHTFILNNSSPVAGELRTQIVKTLLGQ